MFIEDGWYQVGSPEADELGFTPDLFWGNFSKDGNRLFFQYVGSLHRDEGNVQLLYKRLLDDGWDLFIVRPNEIMQHICSKFGMTLESQENLKGRFTDYYNEPCWHRSKDYGKQNETDTRKSTEAETERVQRVQERMFESTCSEEC